MQEKPPDQSASAPSDDSRIAASQQRIIGSEPLLGRILNEPGGLDRRQELMTRIRAKTGRYVVTFVSLVSHPGAFIQPDDIMPLAEILKSIPPQEPIDLMVSSAGGLPDVVEKIRLMCRDGRYGFNTVVPNYAKSAATLLCLGSDQILMGPTSELGPIDPQISKPTGGQWLSLLAHAHVNSYQKIVADINERGKLLPADFPQLANLDIAFIEFCRQQINRSEQLAREWLAPKVGDVIATTVARELSSGKFTASHGKPIDADELIKMGLSIVRKVPATDEVWQMFWELYVRSELFMRNSGNAKVFETEAGSFGQRVTT